MTARQASAICPAIPASQSATEHLGRAGGAEVGVGIGGGGGVPYGEEKNPPFSRLNPREDDVFA